MDQLGTELSWLGLWSSVACRQFAADSHTLQRGTARNPHHHHPHPHPNINAGRWRMNKNEVTHATKTIIPASLIQHDMWQPHPTFTVLKTARTVSPPSRLQQSPLTAIPFLPENNFARGKSIQLNSDIKLS